jgi:hypothetical protein
MVSEEMLMKRTIEFPLDNCGITVCVTLEFNIASSWPDERQETMSYHTVKSQL